MRQLAALGLVAVAACIGGTPGGDGGACGPETPCPGGSVCFAGRCVAVCSTDRDCEPTQACVSGACADVPSPACARDADCNAPSACRIALSSQCSGGACQYECRSPCRSNDDCPQGQWCRGDGVCAPQIADGASCITGGAAACDSGWCDNGICCRAGNCCVTPTDCPPSFTASSTCLDTSSATSCQGERWTATCSNFVCGSDRTDDDSGCDGYERDCAPYAPVVCSADASQPLPVCGASCGSSSECASGNGCVGAICQPIAGLGAECTGSGQGTCSAGLKCENDRCCVATDPTCCTDNSHCGAGLACDAGSYTCFSTCNDYTSNRCADPVNRYCLNEACVAKIATGVGPCVHGGQCASGHCADGLCCATACEELCEACRASLTGLADGSCGRIRRGEFDTSPGPLCTPDGDGCAAAACACDGNGGCIGSDNTPCANHGDCASGVCECFDASCTDRRCRSSACGVCEMGVPAGGCVTGLGVPSPVDDPTPGQCGGGLSCYAGNCRRDDGETCSSNNECGNVCLGATCAARSALNGPCDAGDGNADCQTGLVCAAGQCKRPSGAGCGAGSECQLGYCVTGVCCASACTGPCAVCDVSGNGTCTMPADDAACGTIACSSLSGTTQCRDYADLTANRCAAIGSCKTVSAGACSSFTDNHSRCGMCQVCSAASCAFVTSGQDPRDQCSPADSECGSGACDGSGACVNYGSSTSCTNATGCSATCDGSGDCGTTCTCSSPCGTLCPGTECYSNQSCLIQPGEPGTLMYTCSGTCARTSICQ